MANSTLILLLLLVVALQGLVATPLLGDKFALRMQLKLLNKPASKSFTLQSSFGVSKMRKSKDSSSEEVSSSLLLPKNIRCPRGTVIVKRIKEDDLIVNNMISSSLGIVYTTTTNSSISDTIDNAPKAAGQQTGLMKTFIKTKGVGGKINIWNVPTTQSQSILSSIFVTSADGSTYNHIQAGWAIVPGIYKVNSTLFYGYWTRDDGKTTGCLNNLCPGFVQTSAKYPIGLFLSPISTYKGRQFAMHVKIKQDDVTKNWMLMIINEVVGYWPKELFTTLTSGAAEAGWGGGILSPNPEPTPGMGSGHFPQEGFGKACFIGNLELYGIDVFPAKDHLFYALSKPDCYKAKYIGKVSGSMDHVMFFGGPPNCKF